MSIENLGIFFLAVWKLKPKNCFGYKGEINRLLVVQLDLFGNNKEFKNFFFFSMITVSV